MAIGAGNIKFRYDINALRAIAVIGVLFFHYKVPGFGGGFAGVDVFFVISGYLMSRIIINGIATGEFTVLGFYAKRIKRIVPALLFLVIVLTIVGFFIYFPDDYKLNQKNALASVLFLSNFFYLLNSGYFAEASDSNILLHTWSLSVEWQFYMLYPILLLLASKYVKRRTYLIIPFVLIVLLLYTGSVYFTKINSEASFYLLPSRAWEMLFGGIAFLCEDIVKGIKVRRGIAMIGYCLIFVSVATLRTTMPWPGMLTIIPVIGTVLVIIANCNDLIILKNGIMQLIGRISYSLYLWHWPVYVIAQYMGIEWGFVSISIMILLSGLSGYLSYKYIESIEFKNARSILAAILVCIICTAGLSFINTNDIVFKPNALYLANYKNNHANATKKRLNTKACPIPSGCLTVEQNKSNLLLIGDSHAAHIWIPLKKAMEKRNINLIKAAGPGCFPILTSLPTNCSAAIAYIYNDFIRNNADKIDGVMISVNWIAMTDKKQFVKDMNTTIGYLKKYKINVILIGQNETYKLNYPTVKAKELHYNTILLNRYIDKEAYRINDLLKSNFKPYYVEIINHNKFPGLSVNNIPYMIDENHFTEYGADLAVKKMLVNPITMKFLAAAVNAH